MNLQKIYNRLSDFPGGKKLFSLLVCWNAPYFGSISPVFTELKQGAAAAQMKNRRKVHNHIKTVHAIACCNLCELVAGTAMIVSLPADKRWIPKGMQVQYLRKATTDLSARCEPGKLDAGINGDFPVSVDVTDSHGQVVVSAIITMYISDKKQAV